MSGSDPARILVVDDDPMLLRILPQTLSLRLSDVDIQCESSPQLALDRLRAAPFDVVLSDWRMPEMNGTEFLQKVRHIAPATSILLMTAYGDTKKMAEAQSLGAEFVEKPVDRDAFAALIKEVLRRRTAR